MTHAVTAYCESWTVTTRGRSLATFPPPCVATDTGCLDTWSSDEEVVRLSGTLEILVPSLILMQWRRQCQLKRRKVFEHSKYNAESMCCFLEIFALIRASSSSECSWQNFRVETVLCCAAYFLFVFLRAHQGYLNPKDSLLGTREEIWLPFKLDTIMACSKNWRPRENSQVVYYLFLFLICLLCKWLKDTGRIYWKPSLWIYPVTDCRMILGLRSQILLLFWDSALFS